MEAQGKELLIWPMLTHNYISILTIQSSCIAEIMLQYFGPYLQVEYVLSACSLPNYQLLSWPGCESAAADLWLHVGNTHEGYVEYVSSFEVPNKIENKHNYNNWYCCHRHHF